MTHTQNQLTEHRRLEYQWFRREVGENQVTNSHKETRASDLGCLVHGGSGRISGFDRDFGFSEMITMELGF